MSLGIFKSLNLRKAQINQYTSNKNYNAITKQIRYDKTSVTNGYKYKLHFNICALFSKPF